MSDAAKPHGKSSNAAEANEQSLRAALELRERFQELVGGNFATQIVYVAAKLSIPDLLAEQPMTVEQIAERAGAHAQSIRLMMRALAVLDLFAQDADGRYRLTPLGELFKSNPGWRTQALLIGEEYFRASGELLHTMRTGERAFDRAFGSGIYDYLRYNREAAFRFNEVMTLNAPLRYTGITEHYDFSRARVLVDVGAGQGAFAAIIMRECPQLRAILLDMPQMIAGAERYLTEQGLAARCEFRSGDFFESVPAGGDLYVLSSVINNWNDERAIVILGNCRRVMTQQQELLIAEAALVGRRVSRASAVVAVAAYAIQGSITRDAEDYRSLLSRAGFELREITPLSYEPYALIRATPVSGA
jgi:ubiquinone/menaquinone biosynthesis C-methylase UbiE